VPAHAAWEIERGFREEHGRAVAVLVRVFGDIDIAEEAVQEAFIAAVQRWPSTELPPADLAHDLDRSGRATLTPATHPWTTT